MFRIDGEKETNFFDRLLNIVSKYLYSIPFVSFFQGNIDEHQVHRGEGCNNAIWGKSLGK